MDRSIPDIIIKIIQYGGLISHFHIIYDISFIFCMIIPIISYMIAYMILFTCMICYVSLQSKGMIS
jgi:hypothetical protein